MCACACACLWSKGGSYKKGKELGKKCVWGSWLVRGEFLDVVCKDE